MVLGGIFLSFLDIYTSQILINKRIDCRYGSPYILIIPQCRIGILGKITLVTCHICKICLLYDKVHLIISIQFKIYSNFAEDDL